MTGLPGVFCCYRKQCSARGRDNRDKLCVVFICWLAVILVGSGRNSFLYGKQTIEAEGKIIHALRLEGNVTVPDSVLLAKIHSRAGAVLSEKLLSEDAQRLIGMPEVYDVTWQVVPFDKDKVDVVFTISETKSIRKLTIIGNKHIKTKKLLNELKFKTGDYLDQYLLSTGTDALEKYYHDKGYYFATVKLQEEKLKDLEVVYEVVEGPHVRINKVKFIGNDKMPGYKLGSKIKSKAYFPIFRKGKLDDEQLERDVRALAEYYHDEGFLDARVFVRKVFNEKKTRVALRFIIEEGPRYKIAGITFEGNKVFSREELLKAVPDIMGKVLSKKRLTFIRRALTRIYGKSGYIYTRIRSELNYTDKEGEVALLFKISEGKQYKLARLIVRGNRQTKDKVVRRNFDKYGFLPGRTYNSDAAERARNRLLGSGLFEDVTVNPAGSLPKQRDALVEVKEARTGLMIFGVGVDTNNGVIGQISLEQRNFDAAKYPRSLGELLLGEAFKGGGQTMRIDFEPGTRVSRGRFHFYEPYLFDQPYYMDLNLFLFRRWRESYLERRRGGTVTFGRRFDNDWFVDGTLRMENITVSDIDTDYRGRYYAPQDVIDVKGDNLITSVKGSVGRNTTDRRFRPTEGYKVSTGWEQYGAMGGDFSFAALTAGGTLYKTVYMDITERKTVWAGHIEGANIVGSAPVFERYYAGGIGSIRGFDYRGVSPRGGPDRDPIGSDYLVLAGTEITHPLFEETLYGKLFLDTGLVSEGPWRAAVGFGFELLVPQLFQAIPMQFNFGFPLVEDREDDDEVFSFSFGVTF